MCADAWTYVVVANADEAERFAGVFRQFVEFHSLWNGVTSDKLVSDGEVLLYEFV